MGPAGVRLLMTSRAVSARAPASRLQLAFSSRAASSRAVPARAAASRLQPLFSSRMPSYGFGDAFVQGQPLKCKAAVAWGPKQPIKVEEVIVDPPRAGEVRVRVIANALCHTDIYCLDGHDPEGLFPSILGHEAGAIVVDVGPGVTSVKPGDHVIPCYTPECGQTDCVFCMSDKTNLCPKIRSTQGQGLMPDGTSRFKLAASGEPLFHFMGCSTFAEYTVLAEISCAVVPKSAPLDEICMLGCGVATGWGAVWQTCKVEAGSSVAVFGLGAVGLSVVQAAKVAGARTIYAIDINPSKADAAAEFGATDFVDVSALPEGTTIVQELQKRTQWGVDYTFDCTGNTTVMRQALEAAHRGWGVSCVIGVAGAGKEIATRPFQLVTGRSWRGTAFGGWKSRTHVPQLVRRVLSGELPISRYVTHRMSGIEATSDAIAALHSGNCLRAVVTYARPEPAPSATEQQAVSQRPPGFPAAGASAGAAGLRLLSDKKAAGGTQLRLAHDSAACDCEMTFSAFLPPDPHFASSDTALKGEGRAALLWLSGLTCTDENVVQKAGFQAHAARFGLAVLCPDTSPRGTSLPGEHDSFSLGSGASFYLDATREPWSRHYRMESYLRDELLPLASEAFGLSAERLGISGHSMGGHGALSLFFRNSGLFKSVSALAPICNPIASPWGRKAFETYLGSVDAGAAHDATELVGTFTGTRVPILVDQGAADEFLRTELMPERFARACAAVGHPLNLRTHAKYDHSYLFVASFIADHIAHHAASLGAGQAVTSCR